MTPEERNRVTELFDRLATLEDASRDRDAERMIQDGLRQAPNASYALVQTVLVQEDALKRADARIHALEAELGGSGQPPGQGGFLDPRRDSPWSRRDAPRAGSVPTVRPAGVGVPPGYRTDAAAAEPVGQPPAGTGGSFLGTAAAAAVGMIGGSLLLGGIRSMMGHQAGSAHAATDPTGGSASPWASPGGSGDLARQAGLDDIGRGTGGQGDAGRGHGLFDSDAARTDAPDETDGVNDIVDDEDLGDFSADFDGEDE
jgi:hypothetical protein